MHPLKRSIFAIVVLVALLFQTHEAQPQAVVDGIPNELKVLPFFFFKYPNTKRTLLFIWSRNCEECHRVFSEYIGPFISGPKKGRAYVVIIQYETNPVMIDHVMTLTCSGNKVYAWAALRYLFHGEDETAARKSEPRDVTGSRVQLCRDRTAARKAIESSMKEIKRQYKVATTPAVFLDRRQITEPARLSALLP